MSVIRGQINIKNDFSKSVADIKLKFVIKNDENNYSCEELFFNDILQSVETHASFSATVPTAAKIANVNVTKVTVELETRVRPTTDLLKYQIYRAKFNESIDLPLEDSNLNLIVGSEKFSLNVLEIGSFDVTPILVHTHQLAFNEKRDVARGCTVSLNSNKTKNEDGRWFFKLVYGLNIEQISVTEDDLKNFDDNFGRKLVEFWKNGTSIEEIPFSMRYLLRKTLINMKQKSFVVADGAHIPWSEETKEIDRRTRLVVTCQSDQKQPTDLIYIVSSPILDSTEQFLQVAAWSNTLRAFNFYQRNNESEWWWLGNSWDALKSPTRGHGPFDGHVNGSLVMKELNRPWLHWHSQLFTLFDCLNPEDPFINEPVFENRSDAAELEHIIKDAVSEWNTARLDKSTDFSSLNVTDVKEFMRQIIDNTTYNIISIDKEFSSITLQDDLFIPASFFINLDIINQLSDFIDPDLSPVKIKANMYLESIKKYGVCLKDGDKIVQQGDGMFAFPVPEPSFEDTSLISILINERKIKGEGTSKIVPPLLSSKFILCLLMIDYCNPLDSAKRSRLLAYVPETAYYDSSTKKYDLVDKIVKNIREAAWTLPEHSTEADFIKYWDLNDEDLKTNCKQIIEQYFTKLQTNLQNQDSVDDLVRLANSRRNMFRRKALSEFDLTLPICNNISSNALMLEMTPLGTVRPVLNNPRSKLNNFFTTNQDKYILDKFDPPAYLKDMNSDLQIEWDKLVRMWTQNAIKGYPDDFTFDGPRLQYYDPTSTYTSGVIAEADIVWTAFPNRVGKRSVTDKKRWETADSFRDAQDEYCEWSVLRDHKTGKIMKVTFTCEGPEYWGLIAEKDPDKLVKLYKELISPDVKKEDLFDSNNNKYIPRNKWNNNTNTGNIMHLTQINNTLEAEIELAGGSSVVRIINGRVLTTEQELIKCGGYGDPDRFSDPHIGATVNNFARRSADVTIRNPVAIYLDDLDTSAFNTPDDSEAYSYWKFVRGNEDKKLFVRAVYEVPADKGFCVGDIKINGKEIKYGAQIADFLTIRIPAVACRIGESPMQALTGCRREKPKNLTNLSVVKESTSFMRSFFKKS